MNDRRVVVTGTGTVNPMGNTVQETWQTLMRGRSVIRLITRFDASQLNTRIAGEVDGFDYRQIFPASMLNDAKRMDAFCHYAVAAAREAARQSGLEDIASRERIGVALGSGIGGLNLQHRNSVALVERGPRRVSPFYVPMSIGNMAAGIISMRYGIGGPNLSLQTACASANHAIAMAQLIIRDGMADVMIAGGSEGTINELAIAGFGNMHALSTRNEEPERASRPFDRDRDGFVLSEGAAVLVLEEYGHARARGATVLCEVVACGMSGDGYGFVAPDPEGHGAYRSMRMALEQAGMNPGDIDYINAHGTATPAGDIAELRGVHALFGSGATEVCVGSTKSYHGHLLGATAGVEAILCIETLQHGIIPANINLDTPDPELPPVWLPREIVERPVRAVMSNSFGFGGHNSSLLLKAAD